jgi:hypothetical protein
VIFFRRRRRVARGDSSGAIVSSAPLDPSEWGWADEVPDAAIQQMASVALSLLTDPERWIHRRVEQIEFIDRQTIRRQVSVDFTLPNGLTSVGSFDGRDIYLAPLFLLKRDHPRPVRVGRKKHWWTPQRPSYRRRLPMSLFSDLDFVDDRGRRLPLITREQSVTIANAMLQQAAVQVIGGPVSDATHDLIADIADGSRGRRKKALRDIFLRNRNLPNAGERTLLRSSPIFAELACMIATHLPVICLFTEGPPGRSIVKLSYVEPLEIDHSSSKGRIRRSLGVKSENLAVGISEIGAAASHHIEISIPDDLRVNYVSLTGKNYTVANVPWQKLNAESKDYAIRQVGSARAGNLYLTELPHSRRMGRVSIKMRVRRSRFLMGALVASGIITLVLTVLALVAKDILEADQSEALVAALLLLPSVVATYIARPGEHVITARMLRWARFALVGNAALPFIAILVFLTTPAEVSAKNPGVYVGGLANSILGVLQEQDSPVHGLQARWGFLAIASALCTCLFVASNIWPRPHGTSSYSLRSGE